MERRGREEILDLVRKAPHPRVQVAIVDVDGVLRGKYLDRDKFLDVADSGFGFCDVVFGWDSADVCYSDAAFTGWHSGYPDATAVPDLSTYRLLPWEDGVPFFLADFVAKDGAPLGVCPRRLLRRILDRAAAAGFHVKAGCEYEWFNFRETPESLAKKRCRDPEPATAAMFGYSVLRAGLNRPFFVALQEDLRAFGIPLEGLHTETGPGVVEAAIAASDALEAADRAALFRTGAKLVAYRHGLVASFMAKWSENLPGCSGHVHHSLWGADGTNVFFEAGAEANLSPLGRSWLAGLLEALPEILPFFAPTVNSYKRLVEGFWAPTRSTWGIDNRTVAFRAIAGSAKSTRIEARIPGSDANPYLALAAIVAAGLSGVERKLELTEPAIVGSAYACDVGARLPKTLAEATDRLAGSALARDLFGAEFVDHFVTSRRHEWNAFRKAVTDWELTRYFEII